MQQPSAHCVSGPDSLTDHDSLAVIRPLGVCDPLMRRHAQVSRPVLTRGAYACPEQSHPTSVEVRPRIRAHRRNTACTAEIFWGAKKENTMKHSLLPSFALGAALLLSVPARAA